jgi:hypothetical protein
MIFILFSAIAAQCISLKESRHCAEYSGYSVVPEKGKFETIEEFHQFIENGILFQFGSDKCSEWPTMDTSIPLHSSFSCAYAVYLSKQCNHSPKNMCRSALEMVLSQIKESLQQHCPSSIGDEQFIALERYVAISRNDDCFLSIGPDASKRCGMDTKKSLEFCSMNPNTLCCTTHGNFIPALEQLPKKPDNGEVNPIFIGGGIIGLLLILALIFTLVFVRKRIPVATTNRTAVIPSPPMHPSPILEQPEEIEMDELLVCKFEYEASLLDELTLRAGDYVRVLKRFDDGWAYGVNETTQTQGTFPAACLETVDSDKRNSSLVKVSYPSFMINDYLYQSQEINNDNPFANPIELRNESSSTVNYPR